MLRGTWNLLRNVPLPHFAFLDDGSPSVACLDRASSLIVSLGLSIFFSNVVFAVACASQRLYPLAPVSSLNLLPANRDGSARALRRGGLRGCIGTGFSASQDW